MTREPDARRTRRGGSFLMGPEAQAWVEAAEAGQAEPDVSDVAVSAIRRDYGRTARLVLGWAMVPPLVISVTLLVLLLQLLQGPTMGAETGSLLAGVFFVVILVAAAGGTIVMLLQRSGRRLTRAAAVWIRAGLAGPAHGHPLGEGTVESVWAVDLSARAAYLVLSGLAIVLNACLTVGLADAEGGAATAPLSAAVAVQLVIAMGVANGVRRVLGAYVLVVVTGRRSNGDE